MYRNVLKLVQFEKSSNVVQLLQSMRYSIILDQSESNDEFK